MLIKVIVILAGIIVSIIIAFTFACFSCWVMTRRTHFENPQMIKMKARDEDVR